MKTEIGLWIDHKKAVIVKIKGKEEDVKEIVSNMEKRIRYSDDAKDTSAGEDVRDRKFDNHLNAFYDRVIGEIRDADTIQIFGPGEAKGELKKRMEKAGLKVHIFPLETVDKMTDRQVAAKVREHSPS